LAVDQATNDVYALDAGAGKLYRYESSGAPHAFTAGSHEGNALTGFTALGPSAAEVAVDNSAGFLSSDIYVADASGVRVFAQSGEQLGALDGSAANKGKWTFNACGVAVDQSSGTVYVGDLRGYVWQYAPTSPAGAITDADYTVKGMKPKGMQPCSVAADSAGRVYAAQATDGPVQRFAAASFVAGNPPTVEGSEIDEAGKALAVDPATNELYVDEGDQISVFDTSGDQVRTIGAGKLACGELGSRGVSVNKTSHHVYASCFVTGSIKEFGYEVPPFTPVDNPAILHAANRVEAHSYGDFQVTPDGRFAAFATSMPLQAGYDNASHLEVYLYGSQADELTCVSCASTEAQAATDSTLPPNGLGVLEDGRVFFNSGDQLTLRDTNEKLDAYEWEDGVQQLISAGTSAYPSGMLGVSADGTDAFFFTRDTLVGEDENGPTMKVYDAREDGGRFVLPPSPPCAAADECHGPGTQAAPQPQVGTLNGSGGQFEEARSVPKVCKKPKVRRKGRCVKPRRKARHKHAAQRGGHR
ncbi:MAG TPA: hypothetical protein VNL97_00190, partial [Solirubrobacterales bacterium]|nr:hypothetical protein [Solirubrobacterales bacterium]